ncbi:MAG: PmeII family type II restriction endonuclease [Candidatus Tenebribacter burtonii]|nr:PmeII family type II restriction endonuclease [Candidatus Tenebribacter burtonii]
MKQISIDDIKEYIEQNIDTFHVKRIEKLKSLKLKTVLKRKNPYLFKAKNILDAHDIVKKILDAYLSSQEETIFGDFLEGLAIFINTKVFSGYKSGITGIDLEFIKTDIRYLVSIKSGPNWGNSSQITKMKQNFLQAKKVIRVNNPDIVVECVNGCCYGRDSNPDKGNYYKLCGQKFWEFISGNSNLYTEIIEPLGHKAKQRNSKFNRSYSKVINQFTYEFTEEFCDDGEINWNKIIKLNSSINPKEYKS